MPQPQSTKKEGEEEQTVTKQITHGTTDAQRTAAEEQPWNGLWTNILRVFNQFYSRGT